MPKLVSIITINLNNSSGLEQTIQSVTNQSFTNYEFLVIDGGSIDGSREIISANSGKINYWVSEPDKGIYHAMNKGIKKAKGQYCLFLNSGDWLANNQVLKNCFQKSQKDDLLLGSCRVLKDGNILYVTKPTLELSLRSFYKGTIPHQATFIKRTLFDEFGLYDESLRIHSDYKFWIQVIIKHHCSVSVLNHQITNYNLNGLSSSSESQDLSFKEVDQILNWAFPKRVLADYEHWKKQESELQMLHWIKSKRILYKALILIYQTASQVIKYKRFHSSHR